MKRLSETKGVTGIVCGLLLALAMSCASTAQSDADSDSIAAADSAGLNELRERQRADSLAAAAARRDSMLREKTLSVQDFLVDEKYSDSDDPERFRMEKSVKTPEKICAMLEKRGYRQAASRKVRMGDVAGFNEDGSPEMQSTSVFVTDYTYDTGLDFDDTKIDVLHSSDEVVITFGSNILLDAFMESVKKSGMKLTGGVYSYPGHNECQYVMLEVKDNVATLRQVIECWE